MEQGKVTADVKSGNDWSSRQTLQVAGVVGVIACYRHLSLFHQFMISVYLGMIGSSIWDGR